MTMKAHLTQDGIPTAPRRAWVRPAYQRLRAGDAESKQNPTIVSDGSFTKS